MNMYSHGHEVRHHERHSRPIPQTHPSEKLQLDRVARIENTLQVNLSWLEENAAAVELWLRLGLLCHASSRLPGVPSPKELDTVYQAKLLWIEATLQWHRLWLVQCTQSENLPEYHVAQGLLPLLFRLLPVVGGRARNLDEALREMTSGSAQWPPGIMPYPCTPSPVAAAVLPTVRLVGTDGQEGSRWQISLADTVCEWHASQSRSSTIRKGMFGRGSPVSPGFQFRLSIESNQQLRLEQDKLERCKSDLSNCHEGHGGCLAPHTSFARTHKTLELRVGEQKRQIQELMQKVCTQDTEHRDRAVLYAQTIAVLEDRLHRQRANAQALAASLQAYTNPGPPGKRAEERQPVQQGEPSEQSEPSEPSGPDGPSGPPEQSASVPGEGKLPFRLCLGSVDTPVSSAGSLKRSQGVTGLSVGPRPPKRLRSEPQTTPDAPGSQESTVAPAEALLHTRAIAKDKRMGAPDQYKTPPGHDRGTLLPRQHVSVGSVAPSSGSGPTRPQGRHSEQPLPHPRLDTVQWRHRIPAARKSLMRALALAKRKRVAPTRCELGSMASIARYCRSRGLSNSVQNNIEVLTGCSDKTKSVLQCIDMCDQRSLPPSKRTPRSLERAPTPPGFWDISI